VRLAPWLVGVAFALAAGASARAESDAPPPPRPWLGIGFADNGGIAQVTDVHPGTGAAAAGILPDDMIIQIDGIPLNPSVGLAKLVTARKVGQRITVTLLRRNGDGYYGEPMTVTPRLSAMPTTDELVYRRLFDRTLPALSLFDRHAAAVPVADWTRRPQVWAVFTPGCDVCASAATALRTRLAASEDGAADAPLRTIVIGQHAELSAFMARVPLVGTVWRIDPGNDERRSVVRFFLSGVDPDLDGVVLVVDHRGIVRFATAMSAGEAAHDGACAAAARAVRAWRP